MALAVGVVLTGLARLIGLDPAAEVEVGGLVILVCLAGRARWWAGGAIFWAGLVASTGVYLIYLVRATFLLGSTPESALLGAVLLVLELGAIALILASAFEMVDALCSPTDVPPLPSPPARWPAVCLQVATYNEPPDLVIETIRSLAAIDYPALRIQVIDNNTTEKGRWQPLEAECARLRKAGHEVEFVHLASWPGFKAGALNWGRTHLDPDVEIVGVIDADFVVDPGFLRATVPYFTDPAVAFVQTPQDYRAWEESSYYRACYVGFAYFFKVGMVSRAHRNAIIFAGTMGLIRRSVLDEIGGWDEEIITEDADASLRILARRYRSIYVPTAFGQGIMPLTYEGLRKQRFRWAFGGIQILRRHWRALLPWSRRSGPDRRATIRLPGRESVVVQRRADIRLHALHLRGRARSPCWTSVRRATPVGNRDGHPTRVHRPQPAAVSVGDTRCLWIRDGSGAGSAAGEPEHVLGDLPRLCPRADPGAWRIPANVQVQGPAGRGGAAVGRHRINPGGDGSGLGARSARCRRLHGGGPRPGRAPRLERVVSASRRWPTPSIAWCRR